jgi:CHAT domain-containing protein
VQTLRLRAAHMGIPARTAARARSEVARTLTDVFLGRDGRALVERLDPTALLLDVDETILNLPWELLGATSRRSGSAFALRAPFGRTVTTRLVPAPTRSPVGEDPAIRILAIENPSDDLTATAGEVDAIVALEGNVGGVDVSVTALRGADVTRADVRKALRDESYDILHFAGHASFDTANGEARIVLQGADLTADDVLKLPWAAPPYIVVNSACESAQALPGRRLVSRSGHGNGMAAAFLARGCEAYLGHLFPIADERAATFAGAFYTALFERRNLGLAVLDARRALAGDGSRGGGGAGSGAGSAADDGSAFGSVCYGDVATGERRDIIAAAD